MIGPPRTQGGMQILDRVPLDQEELIWVKSQTRGTFVSLTFNAPTGEKVLHSESRFPPPVWITAPAAGGRHVCRTRVPFVSSCPSAPSVTAERILSRRVGVFMKSLQSLTGTRTKTNNGKAFLCTSSLSSVQNARSHKPTRLSVGDSRSLQKRARSR